MLSRHLRLNLWAYLLVLITLGAGVVVGAMKSPLTLEVDLAASLLARLTPSKMGLTVAQCVINQIPWWLTLALLGLTVIGILLVIPLVFFKGYCVGYTIFTLARANGDTGMGLALTAVLPHNLFYIPSLLVMAVAAIKLSGVLFNPERRGRVIIRSVFSYLLVVCLAGMVMVVGALVECRITPWLLHWW